ncbi:antiviral reverse transcriptase Drt3b [Rhizobium tubonense]|uniref:Reverse transcriptase n=1 Tax=Rhizobium tubonense TaxID=484088 RepID=A0A2W4C815_9HYPH|nr:antiviral reverse transcriptase Drt3b [Rhizobium tubonense]PZM07558.1 reverse transcriptase [Rhizobium tubonense]
MSNKLSAQSNGKYRSLLSDMLPFEVPLTFGNHRLVAFLSAHDVSVKSGGGPYAVSWRADDDRLDPVMSLLFGMPADGIHLRTAQYRGRTINYRQINIPHNEFETLPFKFRVAHKENVPRELSVIHPRNQVLVAEFYREHSGAIIYSASKSEYSIRRPTSVAKTIYFKDKIHYDRLDQEVYAVEQHDMEYEVSGSYFVYRDYSNIHRFFESPKYHRSERRFSKMLKLDISKCFDSIYTHSLPWAVIGKERTKDSLNPSKSTYAGKFDTLMQKMNRNETNGIITGSEFSRIFAEIILQSVDVSVEMDLRGRGIHHRVDYDLYRYVDDYFLFYEAPEVSVAVLEALAPGLREVKLNLNTAKTISYDKPIITEITVAKNKIAEILNGNIRLDLTDTALDGLSHKTGSISLNPTRLITSLKAAIKESNVSYEDILNYTLAVIEKRCQAVVRNFFLVSAPLRQRRDFVQSLHALVEVIFFIYSGAPKVNHTIRVCKTINIIVETLKNAYFNRDERHAVFKMIFDCARAIIKANRSRDHQQVETIYLLGLLKELGREYWLDDSLLCEYFGIERIAGVLCSKHDLNVFAITSLLQYIDGKTRYAEIRSFLESAALAVLEKRRFHIRHDTECLLLLLDLLACPHVTGVAKDAALAKFGINAGDTLKVIEASAAWFTAWLGFKYGDELDRKRSREVY